ncbi:MAG: chitobiase/beta-hexosaminidase C-terminal domain-containing protein, partial [Flavobacteriaceae bacterium]|nr:chitobiase/beta-hexosaminidase C-terminal domain-containing protein [Flavobacteriaceae bacterium]
FLSLEQNSKDINLTGNNFSSLKRPFIIDETIEINEIKTTSNLTGLSTAFEQLQPNIKRDSLGMVSMYYPNNANIFYTTDGTHPKKTSQLYSQPFEQIGAITISAKAIENNKESSTETLKLESTEVLVPQIFPKDQFFNKEIKVALSSNTKDATIYYSLDGTTPTKNSLKYKNPIHIQKSVELKTIAVKDGYADSKVAYSKFETIEQLSGVQYKYYELKLEKLPNFVNHTPIRTGVMSAFSFHDIEHEEFHFAMIMHAFIDIKRSGEYQFFVSSNDGSKLLIDHQEIVNNDYTHGTREKTGKMQLDKGMHLIELRYFQAGGGKALQVFISGDEFKKTEITASMLSH